MDLQESKLYAYNKLDAESTKRFNNQERAEDLPILWVTSKDCRKTVTITGSRPVLELRDPYRKLWHIVFHIFSIFRRINVVGQVQFSW